MIKKITWLGAVLVAVALFFALPVWPGTVPASIVPDGVRWIAHLDMEKFVATKLYGYLEKDGRFEIKSRDITRWLKIDVARDVTGVTIFGTGADEKGAVLAVAGRFDKAGLLALLSLDEDHKEYAYGGNTIYSMDGDEFGAFVNDGLIVFAENREAIEKALDTAAGKAKNFASSKLSASLKDVSSGAFFSGVVEDLVGLGEEIHQSKFFEKARGMHFLAQETGDSLKVRAQITSDSPENAKDMADLAQGLVALGRLSEGQDRAGRFASLVDGLQVKLEGNNVRLEFDRPSREIADILSQSRGGLDFFD